MSDEIKVNSVPLPQNLATLGQVKDALGKRDKKIDSLKEDKVDKKQSEKNCILATDDSGDVKTIKKIPFSMRDVNGSFGLLNCQKPIEFNTIEKKVIIPNSILRLGDDKSISISEKKLLLQYENGYIVYDIDQESFLGLPNIKNSTVGGDQIIIATYMGYGNIVSCANSYSVDGNLLGVSVAEINYENNFSKIGILSCNPNYYPTPIAFNSKERTCVISAGNIVISNNIMGQLKSMTTLQLSAENGIIVYDSNIKSVIAIDRSAKPSLSSIILAVYGNYGKNVSSPTYFTIDGNPLGVDLTSKADKTSLAQTDRKLDALWKLNQGISYEFQTDDAEAYQKTVPSGAKVASIKSIGGKTIVWNQLNLNSEKSITKNGISFINNKDGSWTINGTCSVSNDDVISTIVHPFASKYVSGHKYLVKADKYSDGNYGFAINGRTYPLKKAIIINYAFNPVIFVKDKVTVDNVTMRMNIFDLTQMFGAGNEPSTPEEFEDMFPADYYPHNAGELMSVPVNEVMEQGKNLFDQNKESNLLRCSLDRDNIVKTDVSLHPILKIDGLKIGTTYTISYNTALKTSLSSSMLLYSLSTKEATYPSGDFKHEVGTGKTDYNVKLSFSAPQETMYFIGSIMPETISKFQVEESSSITEYKPYRKTSHTIPSVVLELDGYGDGIDNVCNYVDWENKKYHKRIGRYVVTGDEQFYSNPTYIGDNSSNAYINIDIGQKQSTDAKLISNKLLHLKYCWSEDLTYDAMCLNSTQIHIRILNSSLGITNEASAIEAQNAVKKYCKNLHESGDPIIIYYELAEEEIIDISDIIGDTFQEPLEVEAGGTLMFKNSNGDNYRIPVSSAEEYLVSLAEVAK